MEALVPIPETGRTFRVAYTVRLSDTDATGRLRLDAIARYLQDAAIDDVQETGWGAPEHLWVLRSVRIDALLPSLEDSEVGIVTWGSSFSALAAGRRWSLTGDAGGSIEVDSTWIHLGPDEAVLYRKYLIDQVDWMVSDAAGLSWNGVRGGRNSGGMGRETTFKSRARSLSRKPSSGT